MCLNLFEKKWSVGPCFGTIHLNMDPSTVYGGDEGKPLKLSILSFPCSQFGKQEPGQTHEILPGLKQVRPGNGFVPHLPLFEKGDLNGRARGFHFP